MNPLAVIAMPMWSIFEDNFRRKIEFDIISCFLEGVDGEKLLDVACGDGLITCELAKKFQKTYGVDNSGDAIEKAGKRGCRAEFSQGDAHKLPFPNNYFDVVVSNCSLEHFADDRKAIAEMARVLKQGGTIVLTTETYPKALGREYNKWRAEVNCIKNYYTTESLAEKMKGFKIVNYTYYLSGYSMRLYTFLYPMKPRKLAGLGAGCRLHRVLFPIIYMLGSKKSRNKENALGIAVKAVKEGAAAK